MSISAKYYAKKAVEKEMDKIRKECEKNAAKYYHRLWVLALRDEFGFGKDRLKRVLEKVIELGVDISDGRLNFEDIADVIKDETGLDI